MKSKLVYIVFGILLAAVLALLAIRMRVSQATPTSSNSTNETNSLQVEQVTEVERDMEMLLTIVEGSATVTRESGEQVIVTEESAIFVGDLIVTASDSRAFLIFEDNSSVLLNAETELLIEAASRDDDSIFTRLKQEAGQTWTRVKKLTGVETDLELETPETIASVRGTAFDTQIYSDSQKFGVEEGQVKWSLKDGEEEEGAGSNITNTMYINQGEGVEFLRTEWQRYLEETDQLQKQTWGDDYNNSDWVLWNNILSEQINKILESSETDTEGLSLFNLTINWKEVDEKLNQLKQGNVKGLTSSQVQPTPIPPTTPQPQTPPPLTIVGDIVVNLNGFTISFDNLADNISNIWLGIGTDPSNTNGQSNIFSKLLARSDFVANNVSAAALTATQAGTNYTYTLQGLKLENFKEYFLSYYVVYEDGSKSDLSSKLFKTEARPIINVEDHSLSLALPGIISPFYQLTSKGTISYQQINSSDIKIRAAIYSESMGAYYNPVANSDEGVGPLFNIKGSKDSIPANAWVAYSPLDSSNTFSRGFLVNTNSEKNLLETGIYHTLQVYYLDSNNSQVVVYEAESCRLFLAGLPLCFDIGSLQ